MIRSHVLQFLLLMLVQMMNPSPVWLQLLQHCSKFSSCMPLILTSMGRQLAEQQRHIVGLLQEKERQRQKQQQQSGPSAHEVRQQLLLEQRQCNVQQQQQQIATLQDQLAATRAQAAASQAAAASAAAVAGELRGRLQALEGQVQQLLQAMLHPGS